MPDANAIARVCASLGIEIISTSVSPGPGQTTAGATLRRMYKLYGEAHLVTVLRVFVETENTGARIDAFALWAVSDIARAHPEWPNSGLRWLEILDQIDISEMQRQAKANREAVPQRHAIATMLHRELSAAFSRGEANQERENVVAIDNDLIYGTRAIAAFLEIKITLCRDLINEAKIPTFRMPGSTTRCARKSTLNAYWAECEQAEPQRAMAS
jgi:hypothetical protein